MGAWLNVPRFFGAPILFVSRAPQEPRMMRLDFYHTGNSSEEVMEALFREEFEHPRHGIAQTVDRGARHFPR